MLQEEPDHPSPGRQALSSAGVPVMACSPAPPADPAEAAASLLETMASGLPVVITDVGGALEPVADGSTGLLAPARDRDALAKAIVQMARDPQVRRAMGANAGKRIESSFSVERMAASHLQTCLGTKMAFEVVRKESCA